MQFFVMTLSCMTFTVVLEASDSIDNVKG